MDMIFGILGLASLAWLWSEGTQAKEQAMAVAARACERSGVQFLDQTVSLTGMKLARNRSGQMSILRVFRFEFCTTGSERYNGYVTLLGQRLKHVELQHPDGKLIE